MFLFNRQIEVLFFILNLKNQNAFLNKTNKVLLYIDIYLIRCVGVKYRCIFLRVVPYFDEPVERVKIQTTSKIVKAILHSKTSNKRFIIQLQ